MLHQIGFDYNQMPEPTGYTLSDLLNNFLQVI